MIPFHVISPLFLTHTFFPIRSIPDRFHWILLASKPAQTNINLFKHWSKIHIWKIDFQIVCVHLDKKHLHIQVICIYCQGKQLHNQNAHSRQSQINPAAIFHYSVLAEILIDNMRLYDPAIKYLPARSYAENYWTILTFFLLLLLLLFFIFFSLRSIQFSFFFAL